MNKTRKSMEVLLVDESADFLRSAKDFLFESFGGTVQLTVTSATSAQEALDSIAVGMPDLVLIDLSLSRTDSIDAMRSIKSFPNAAKVVVMSLRDEDELRGAATLRGADGYLRKDRLVDALPSMICAVLDGNT